MQTKFSIEGNKSSALMSADILYILHNIEDFREKKLAASINRVSRFEVGFC